MRGWIYIISNPAMPGIIKIGYSMHDPKVRAKELGNTGTPHEYEVLYDILIREPRDIEQQVHAKLHSSVEGKEWFRCSLEEAVRTIRSVAGDRIILESIEEKINSSHMLYACPKCGHSDNKSAYYCKQCGYIFNNAYK